MPYGLQVRLDINFKRWSRKSWAVFASIGKRIRIAVLSLTCTLLSVNAPAQKNDTIHNKDSLDTSIDLDEVIVSAQLIPSLSPQLMRVVQVITRQEIEAAAVTDIGSLLEHVAGIDVRQRGVAGMQADVSIRGGTFEQTLILLNGINMSDPQTGHHNLNIPVDLSTVERIEVLRGPAARIYGPNAFNGVVNIITTSADDNQKHTFIKGSVSGGMYGTMGTTVSLKTNTAGVGHHLSVSGMQTAGYIENTDSRMRNVFYTASGSLKNTLVQLQAALNDKAYGANSFYSAKYPNQYESVRSQFLALSLSPKGKLNYKVHAYWRRHHDRFELFRDDPPAWYSQHNYHMTDAAGSAGRITLGKRKYKTTLGFDYRYEQIRSTILGDSLAEPVPVRGYTGIYFTRSSHRHSFSLLAENSGNIGVLDYSLGMLVYTNTLVNNNIKLFPGLDLGLPLMRSVRLFASINKTLRLPTFTDLYYVSVTNRGNRELQPEEAVTFESGLKYNNKLLKAGVSVFRRTGKNMIDWVRYPSEDIWQAMNHTNITVSGLEADVSCRFDNFAALKWISAAGLHYTYLHPTKNSAGYSSLYVLDIIKHKMDLSLQHVVTPKSGICWKVSFQDRYGGYLKTGGAVQGAPTETPYASVWLVDAKVFYNFRVFQCYLDATNILNTRVVDHANVEQPGIWITAGIKFHHIFNPKNKSNKNDH